MPLNIRNLTISLYSSIIIVTLLILSYWGYSYYSLPVEGVFRIDHPLYSLLKPSGLIGHGLGIVGTLLILIGVFGYMLRKRTKALHELGLLKHWLDAHIFLCSLGTVLVTFHTSFKFGGIVSVGFWSLIAVCLSGIAGRILYIQIPHSIEGRELNLSELDTIKQNIEEELNKKSNALESEHKNSHKERLRLKKLLHKRKLLSRQIAHLEKMRKVFHYWHIVHLPFALIMLIIMAIHVSVVLYFGYKWIF